MTPTGAGQDGAHTVRCTDFGGALGDHAGPGPMRVSLFNIVLPPPVTHTVELARGKPRSHHPTSRVILGQRARFWPKCITLVEGQHRDAHTPLACTVGLL